MISIGGRWWSLRLRSCDPGKAGTEARPRDVTNEIEQWVVAKCRLIAIPLAPHGEQEKLPAFVLPLPRTCRKDWLARVLGLLDELALVQKGTLLLISGLRQ